MWDPLRDPQAFDNWKHGHDVGHFVIQLSRLIWFLHLPIYSEKRNKNWQGWESVSHAMEEKWNRFIILNLSFFGPSHILLESIEIRPERKSKDKDKAAGRDCSFAYLALVGCLNLQHLLNWLIYDNHLFRICKIRGLTDKTLFFWLFIVSSWNL